MSEQNLFTAEETRKRVLASCAAVCERHALALTQEKHGFEHGHVRDLRHNAQALNDVYYKHDYSLWLVENGDGPLAASVRKHFPAK